jgi:hypothetical protein
MFNLRCFKCGWPINLNRAEIEAGVAEAMANGESHHTITCPHCRRTNKVSVKQMRRRLPRGWKPPTTPEPDTAGEEAAGQTD